jgi:hypothetical protein
VIAESERLSNWKRRLLELLNRRILQDTATFAHNTFNYTAKPKQSSQEQGSLWEADTQH